MTETEKEVVVTGNEKPRIGVFVCHCGVNIAGVVPIEDLVEYAKTLPDVVFATEYKFMCSDVGQTLIKIDSPGKRKL